jgi:hypothetical protein
MHLAASLPHALPPLLAGAGLLLLVAALRLRRLRRARLRRPLLRFGGGPHARTSKQLAELLPPRAELDDYD